MTDLVPLEALVRDGHISYGIVQPGTDGSEGVPIVRVKDVRNGVIDTTQPLRVDAQIAAKHSRTRLRGGELLLSLVGTVGESAVVPEELAGWNVARAIAVINPVGVSARWLQLCFESAPVRDQVQSQLNTTVQATLNLSDLKTICIPMPAEPVRRSIEEVLGALDDKIAANTKLAETADDFLSSEFARLVCNSSETQPLGLIADVNKTTVKPVKDGDLRYVDIASVGVGHYDFPELSPWNEAPSRARRALRKGDTIWSTVRPNRRSHALVLSPDQLLVGSTGLAVLSPREVGFAYLYEVTKRPEFTTYLETVAEGSAYPAVRADKFLEAPVPILPIEDRDRFESTASALRLHVESLIEENRALAATRDALLPQLMSGKLRVKDIETTMGEMV